MTIKWLTPYLVQSGWEGMFQLVHEHKVDAVLNVSHRIFLVPPYYHIDEQHHYHVSSTDDIPDFEGFLQKGILWIKDRIGHKERVCIHCEAGANRSVVMTVGYLMSLGIPLEEAYQQVTVDNYHIAINLGNK